MTRTNVIGTVTIAAVLQLVCGASAAWSQDRDTLGVIVGQRGADSHEVELNLPPIVKKYRVPLTRPRRVALGSDGTIYVADWGAGAVVAVDPEGTPRLLAGGLDEPAGLAFDASGNLYVSEHAGGLTADGRILRFTPEGERDVFAENLTGPTGLAFDGQGFLYVANFRDDSVSRISPMGDVQTYVSEIPNPAAVAVDAAGTLFVCSSTEGSVYAVGAMGDVTLLTRGLQGPSDLAFTPEGHLVVANFGGTELSHVDAKGRVRRYATVPKGTIGHFFDPDGNLLLVNWDYHLLMKVVTILSVPCPDCDTPIRVRLREKRPKAEPETKPEEPVI